MRLLIVFHVLLLTVCIGQDSQAQNLTSSEGISEDINGKNEKEHQTQKHINNEKLNEKMFLTTMQNHLNAVTNRDLKTLKTTLSPNGNMQLILPGMEIMYSVDAFMDYHQKWFESPDWTFETKILNTNVHKNFGMAIVEIIYKEPLRDGKPYFNRMTVSYDLEKINNQWYIIKDHASSVEKSDDFQ